MWKAVKRLGKAATAQEITWKILHLSLVRQKLLKVWLPSDAYAHTHRRKALPLQLVLKDLQPEREHEETWAHMPEFQRRNDIAFAGRSTAACRVTTLLPDRCGQTLRKNLLLWSRAEIRFFFIGYIGIFIVLSSILEASTLQKIQNADMLFDQHFYDLFRPYVCTDVASKSKKHHENELLPFWGRSRCVPYGVQWPTVLQDWCFNIINTPQRAVSSQLNVFRHCITIKMYNHYRKELLLLLFLLILFFVFLAYTLQFENSRFLVTLRITEDELNLKQYIRIWINVVDWTVKCT